MKACFVGMRRPGLLLLGLVSVFVLHARCSAQREEPATLRTGTKLVVVDVVVRDKNQNRVRNLRREDFSVLEGGKPQTIQSFEEHTNGAAKILQAQAVTLPAGTYTNKLPPARSSAVNIVLIDTLNTPQKDQIYLRQQLSDYLGTVPPGTDLAVFALNTRLVMLQGFTADPLILKHVLDGVLVDRSPMLTDAQEQNSPEVTIIDTIKDLGMDQLIPPQTQAAMLNHEQYLKSAQVETRSRMTLDGLDVLARYLEGIPGRKNLMWFSGSFPIVTPPIPQLKYLNLLGYDVFAKATNAEREFRETINLFARSQVAVYPIDSRGLMVSSSFSSATKGDPSGIASNEIDFSETLSEEHQTMDRLAQETGGRAYFNTNALADAMRTAVEDGTAYYTLTYRPTNTHWNGELRKISVKAAQRNYTLNYRHTYYADDVNSPKTALVNDTADPSGLPHGKFDDSALTRSMSHGVPVATQISYKERFKTVPGTIDAVVAQANLPVGPRFRRVGGPYRKLEVTLELDPGALLLRQANNATFAAPIEFGALAYDRDGRVVGRSQQTTQIRVTLENFDRFRKLAMPLKFEITLPAKGKYWIRTGLLDGNSLRVGTLEVPFDMGKDFPIGVGEGPAVVPEPTLKTRP